MEKQQIVLSKRVGGLIRAGEARDQLKEIFTDDNHPLYFSKDIEFSRLYKVSRHTIYKIRDELKIPSRSERIINKLNTIDVSQYTLKELSALLNIKYQNLYKLILEKDFRVKPDVQPIEFLKKYQQERKEKGQENPDLKTT